MAPDSDLQLKGILMIQYRKDVDWAAHGLATARATAGHFAHLAADIARANVTPGHGPGPYHPHRGRGANRSLGHGFGWDDTGKLHDAIHVEDNPAVPNGVAEAQVIVDPIEVEGRGKVQYGAYLEFGFTPKLPDGASGAFTRYPFLAPAINDIVKDLPQQLPTIWRQLYNTNSGNGKKNVEMIKVDPSVVGPEEIRNKFRQG